MRFAISYNALSRVFLTILGIGPGKAYVDVSEETVKARLGWSGSATMPRQAIARVERVDRIPWWLGFGMHGSFRGTWALNGAGTGALKITMSRPASGRVLVLPIRATTVYLSLEDPAGFIAAVRG